MTNNDPAPFPFPLYDGATLRDYFATAAMQGLMANDARDAGQTVEAAYVIADAMLKERAK